MTKRMEYEETELRLGLPGGNGNGNGENGEVMMKNNSGNNGNKRGFSEIVVHLKLKLASKDSEAEEKEQTMKEKPVALSSAATSDPAKPPAKAKVVGWPPVRSFRKNILSVHKNGNTENDKGRSTASAAFVKVSVDGAPYLRKVDLKTFKSYQQLSKALSKMFNSFTIGNYGCEEFKEEGKLKDLRNGLDYVPTYEDKDGDWMLVGDVPWEMFVDSCKRLRIMKGSEAMHWLSSKSV